MSSATHTISKTQTPPVAFAPWVEWQQEQCRNGRMLITAVNQREGRAIYLDGADLDPASSDRHRSALAELHDGGFLASDGEVRSANTDAKIPGAGLVWRGADRFVRRSHAAGLRRAFDRPWVIAQLALALVGAVAVVLTLRTDGLELHAHPAQIPAIILLGLVAVFIHEMGHALVTVHYGRRVRMAGLRLHLGSPAFYVESLDALLLTRRQRLLQAAAGPWAEWLATSVAALVFLVIARDGAAAAILQRFVVVNTIVLATNLLPFVGLDGALLFADAIREPDLTFRVSNPAGSDAPADRLFTIYSALNAAVAAALLVMAAFFWWQLFGGLIVALWSSGPVGAVALVVAGLALSRQLWRTVSAALAPVVVHARRIRSRMIFRAQRRWRVKSITAMRCLPEIAALSESELGILAGRLERMCVRSSNGPVVDSPVVVRRALSKASLTKGTVITWIGAADCKRFAGADLVVLPPNWRTFLAQTTNQRSR
ncbi:MAG: hypothetical protein K8R99_09235 [Actinomycetia bacterium]|nr:hypothetical protein [Actinomycetes bacterium]